MPMPEWMKKHPCDSCGEGYGACAQGLRLSLQCCQGCAHPGRWTENPYTEAELIEMTT